MKIKKVLLCNVGPYINENEFEFIVSNPLKSIVLIGGKNGAGKTTLFNAIKICLYGCKAFGYEIVNTNYLTEVDKLINTSEKLNKNGLAKVTIDLFMDDGKNDDLYTIERIWTFSTKKTKEKVTVYRNGKLLGDREKNDFENYLHQLIPPDLFKFYFFDGEKIGDFVFSSEGNNDFKKAFLKLCGLDTLELIKENFRRTYKNKNTNSTIFDDYNDLINQSKIIETTLHDLLQKRMEILSEIDKINEQLILIEKTYYKEGGIDKKDWDSMQEQLKKEELGRDQTRRWLKDIANDVLPFLILRTEIENLKNRALHEKFSRNNNIVKQTLNEKGINIVKNVLKSIGIEPIDEIANMIITSISTTFNNPDITNCEEILLLSAREEYDLLSKIDSILAFDQNKIIVSVESIKKSLQRTKKIRKKIERSNIANWETYISKVNLLLTNKTNFMEQCLKLEHEISETQANKQTLDEKIKKIKSKYEFELKAKSVNDISAKAILAFDQLQTKLYKQFISEIENSFINCFNRLINKQNLLDGIMVDDNLNVYPYKNSLFKKKDILSLIDKQGKDYVKDQVGIKAFEILEKKLVSTDYEISLPIEIKQTLSAGEKQVFIMALYYALSQLSMTNVPYIIDTPFSRIDSEHRKNILEQFFMRLKGQIIILSTDEEIVNQYNDILSPHIANYFILEHQSNNSTKILENSYFRR